MPSSILSMLLIQVTFLLAGEIRHVLSNGRADCIIETDGVLHVIDLKTGNRPVSPQFHMQLMLYALGYITKKRMLNIDMVHLHIIQYYNSDLSGDGHHTTWVCSIADLIRFTKPAVAQARRINRVIGDCAEPSDYEKIGYHCKHCKAIASCKSIEVLLDDLVDSDDDIGDDKVLDIAYKSSLIGDIAKAVTPRANKILSDNVEHHTYYTYSDPSKSRKIWKKGSENKVIELLNDYNIESRVVDSLNKPRLSSPKKLLDSVKHQPELIELINSYTEYTTPTPKLMKKEN